MAEISEELKKTEVDVYMHILEEMGYSFGDELTAFNQPNLLKYNKYIGNDIHPFEASVYFDRKSGKVSTFIVSCQSFRLDPKKDQEEIKKQAKAMMRDVSIDSILE